MEIFSAEIIPFLFFFLGLVGLWIGAEFVLRAAVNIGHHVGLSETFIGLTIVSAGTSLPELFVSWVGAAEHATGVATDSLVVGNIVGSSIGNISLVLGLSGVMGAVLFKEKRWAQNSLMLLLSSVLFIIMSADGMLQRSEGITLMLVYALYFFFLQRHQPIRKKFNFLNKRKTLLTDAIILLIGIFIVMLGSQQVLENGITVAKVMGVSEAVIGIFMIGIGTSLPEIVISIFAAFQGHRELSVSNLVGSNIFNILVIMGSASILQNWRVDPSFLMMDIPFLIFLTIVVIIFLYTKHSLERKESFLLLGLYLAYLVVKVNVG